MKLHNSKRQLTHFGLACGYIEQRNLKGYVDANVTLWREHGTLHVRAHDFLCHKRLFWECPETLTEARKLFAHAEAHICSISFSPLVT